MATSPRLALPYLAENQATAYVTHNSALEYLDALVQLAVESYGNTPPGSPSNGQVYLCGAAPTGAWSGHAQDIACYTGSAWLFVNASEGYLAYDRTTNVLLRYDGSTWSDLLGGGAGYTDEQAQDAVGSILVESATIDLTYTDATPSIAASVIDGSLGAAKLAAGVLTYDVGGTYVGAPPTNEVIMRYPFPRAASFPASLTGSQGVCAVAPSAQTDVDLQKGGVSFGTMRFAASGTTASFLSASGASFAAGDVLTVVTPANLNGLEDLGFALAGTR